MNERFLALLREQLELDAKVKDLQERTIDALSEALEQGHTDTILVSLDNEIYSIGPPKVKTLMKSHPEFFRFRKIGKLT